MKSRLAILLMLVLGFGFSITGAGLAVGGFAGNDRADVAQYSGTKGEGDVIGRHNAGGVDVQPTAQVEAGVETAGGGSLPFTGFAAIPVLLVGAVLLGTGLVARRRAADE